MNKIRKHIEILTEEASAEAALKLILPKIVGKEATVNIIAHQGKGDLQKKLPGKLAVYAKLFRQGQKVVVLLDRDKEECLSLKAQMERFAHQAGLITKTGKQLDNEFVVINRIAVEELEAWFLGDEKAVCTAYPKLGSFPRTLQRKNPDAIKDPFETLASLLRSAGYRSLGGKIELSRKVAACMETNRNRSASFRIFCDGIAACLKG